jgi:hypothetical protein
MGWGQNWGAAGGPTPRLSMAVAAWTVWLPAGEDEVTPDQRLPSIIQLTELMLGVLCRVILS